MAAVASVFIGYRVVAAVGSLCVLGGFLGASFVTPSDEIELMGFLVGFLGGMYTFPQHLFIEKVVVRGCLKIINSRPTMLSKDNKIFYYMYFIIIRNEKFFKESCLCLTLKGPLRRPLCRKYDVELSHVLFIHHSSNILPPSSLDWQRTGLSLLSRGSSPALGSYILHGRIKIRPPPV